MGDHSKIEWTDATWNPATGCTKVSEGCRNCYAERVLPRTKQPFDQIVLHMNRLDAPIHWKKPRRIFVNSLSDLFHKDVPYSFIRDVFDVIRRTPQHVYQILTKRPERMVEFMNRLRSLEALGWANGFYSHVWLGVSIENQQTADERIPLLLDTPSSVRFISAEPLLGPVSIKPYLQVKFPERGVMNGNAYINSHNTNRLDWVIVGGESGPGSRPMHPDWTRSLRDECQRSGVAFFFKQWGEYQPYDAIEDLRGLYGKGPHIYGHGPDMIKVGKKNAGRLLDGRTWDEFPKVKP